MKEVGTYGERVPGQRHWQVQRPEAGDRLACLGSMEAHATEVWGVTANQVREIPGAIAGSPGKEVSVRRVR